MSIGFTIPFARTTGSVGYFETTQDEFSAVREDLRSLLLTNWGERVMHANLGCNFVEFLFEQRTSSLKERIADRVISQVATWLPFITLDELNIIFSEDDPVVSENGIGVKMIFHLSGRPDFSSVFNQIITP